MDGRHAVIQGLHSDQPVTCPSIPSGLDPSVPGANAERSALAGTSPSSASRAGSPGLHAACCCAGGEVGIGPAEALPALAGLHAGGGHARAQLAGLAGQAAAVGAQRQARAAQLLAQRRCLNRGCKSEAPTTNIGCPASGSAPLRAAAAQLFAQTRCLR